MGRPRSFLPNQPDQGCLPPDGQGVAATGPSVIGQWRKPCIRKISDMETYAILTGCAGVGINYPARLNLFLFYYAPPHISNSDTRLIRIFRAFYVLIAILSQEITCVLSIDASAHPFDEERNMYTLP